jgi:hypothetical protein
MKKKTLTDFDFELSKSYALRDKLNPHERFLIPNYHFCRTDRFPGRKGIHHITL